MASTDSPQWDIRENLWILPFGATLIAYLAYVATHPLPHGSAGLYLEAADAIHGAGFGLPVEIPHYTGEGIPFAYPPLALYIAALLSTTGLSGLSIVTLLPGLVTTASIIPFYFVGRELESERVGPIYAGFVGLTPMFLEIKFSANGLTIV